MLRFPIHGRIAADSRGAVGVDFYWGSKAMTVSSANATLTLGIVDPVVDPLPA
jgi:hypothetical protein